MRQARNLVLAAIFSVALCGYVIWSLFSIFPLAAALRVTGG
jgi:hypothetical protein